MTLALLFPGQGTQHAQMLRWLDEAALQHVADRLGADWRAHLLDADWRMRNTVAQPLIAGVCLAAWQQLAPHLPEPAVVAGYSVGELAAWSVAGVFTANDAMALAEARGAVMDAVARAAPTGLLSVSGCRPAMWQRVAEAHGLATAIVLSDEDVILGGAVPALDAAGAQLVDEGIRVTRLEVAIASHTPWLQPALGPWRECLQQRALVAPRCAVVADATAGVVWQPAALRAALADQLVQPLRWDRCQEAVAERAVRCVLEVGPGTTLARQWARRYPDIPVRSVDEFASTDGVVQWVRRVLIRA